MDYKEYTDRLKVPKENSNYEKQSNFVLKMIDNMVQEAFDHGNKSIVLDTNIPKGFPLDNINKMAAPLIEYWASSVFADISEKTDNQYSLMNVSVGSHRTDLADVILQFKLPHENKSNHEYFSGNVDIKSTTDTIKGSGKGPNITSFSKIRTAYILDPDFMFIILSIKYHPYSEIIPETGMSRGIIDLNAFTSYDFKYLSEHDFTVNPSLGTGQIQIKDIHYVKTTTRTTWEFLQLLDEKYLKSSKRTFAHWVQQAEKNKWIK